MNIIAILLVVALGVELSAPPGFAGVLDQKHAVCLLDDDLSDDGDSDESRLVPVCDVLPLVAEKPLVFRSRLTGMAFWLKEKDARHGFSAERWHRWICVERC